MRGQQGWSPCGSSRSATSAFSSFGFSVNPSTTASTATGSGSGDAGASLTAAAVAVMSSTWQQSSSSSSSSNNNNTMNSTPRKVSFEDGQSNHLALSGSSGDSDTDNGSSIAVRSTLQKSGESSAGPSTRRAMVETSQSHRDQDSVSSSASSESLLRRSVSISSNSKNGIKNKKRSLMIRPITSLSLVDLAQGIESEASTNNETNGEYEMEEQRRQAKRLCAPSSTDSTSSLSPSQSTSFSLSSPSEEETNGASSIPWGHFVDMVVSEDEDNRVLTTPLYYLTSPTLGRISPKPSGTFHHTRNNHRQSHHHHPYNSHKGCSSSSSSSCSGRSNSSAYHRSTAAQRIQRTGTPPRHLYLTRALLSNGSVSSSTDGANIRNGTEMPTKFHLVPRGTPSLSNDDAVITNKAYNNSDLVLPQSLIGAFSGLGLQVSAEEDLTNLTVPSYHHLSR